MRSVLALIMLLGCGGASNIKHEGVYVGNPSSTTMRLGVPDSDAKVQRAVLPIDTVLIDRCGETERLAVKSPLDLLSDMAVVIPPGQLCAITLDSTGPLSMGGVDRDGTAWALNFDVGVVDVMIIRDLESIQRDLVLRLGESDWLKAELRSRSDEQINLGQPGDKLHDAVVRRLVKGTVLLVDLNWSGSLDADEESKPPIGQGEPRE